MDSISSVLLADFEFQEIKGIGALCPGYIPCMI